MGLDLHKYKMSNSKDSEPIYIGHNDYKQDGIEVVKKIEPDDNYINKCITDMVKNII